MKTPLQVANELGFKRAKKYGKYKGMAVYVAEMDEVVTIGLPVFILLDGENARLATYDEQADILWGEKA